MSAWRITAVWRPTGRADLDEPFVDLYETHEAAYKQARGYACMNGIRTVTVHAPDGSLAHEYSRGDNIWRAHMPGYERSAP